MSSTEDREKRMKELRKRYGLPGINPPEEKFIIIDDKKKPGNNGKKPAKKQPKK